MGYSQTHRRGFLFTTSVFLLGLIIAAPRAFAGPPRELKLDMEFDDFNSYCDKQTEKGFRLIDVSIYKVGARDLYSAIWEQRADPLQTIRHGRTRADLERDITELVDAKYKLVYLEGKGGGGREKYAGLWEPCLTEFPQVWVGMSPEEFRTKHAELQGKEFSISDLTAFEFNGLVLCAGIWKKENLPTTAVQINLSAAQFKLAMKQKPMEGFRVVRLCAYTLQGAEVYSCLWTKQEGAKQEIRVALPATGIKRVNVQMEKEMMQPIQISVVMASNGPRYSIVYEENK